MSGSKSSPFHNGFRKVCLNVKNEFWDEKLHGVDWQKVTREYEPRVDSVQNWIEFGALVNEMLGTLKASHTIFVHHGDSEFSTLCAVKHQDIGATAAQGYNDGDGDDQDHVAEHIGVLGKRVGSKGEYTVLAVLDGSPAQKVGLKADDVILRANGLPFESAASFRGQMGKNVVLDVLRPVKYDRQDELQQEQSYNHKFGDLAAKFASKSKSNNKTNDNLQSNTLQVTVQPVRENMLRALLKATAKSVRIMDSDGLKIGYIHLWTMAHDSFRDLLERTVLEQLNDTDGLILDLRAGYGGHPFGYGDMFFRPEIAWESKRRHNDGVIRKSMAYNKPMVALIDGGTRSAKEYLSYQFKVSGRAILVGQTTAGAFLEADMFFIGAGDNPNQKHGVLLLPIGGLRLDGHMLERAGVKPDVLVEPRDSYTSKDRQIQKSLEILTKAIRSNHLFL